MFIHGALDARKVAREAQHNPDALRLKGEEQHREGLEIAGYAEKIASYYRKQILGDRRYDLHFHGSIREELGWDTKELAAFHEREAKLLRDLAPPIRTFAASRKSRGRLDVKSREKKHS